MLYETRGSGNYECQFIGTYRFIFQINDGSNNKTYNPNEDYILICDIKFDEWYVSKEEILRQLDEALCIFNIIDKSEIINAFKYRDFYKILQIY